VGIANGKTTPQGCKEVEITIQTSYRWRKEYGGLKLNQAKRLKELEKENTKLKRLVAEHGYYAPDARESSSLVRHMSHSGHFHRR
jgi:hypothetical protein